LPLGPSIRVTCGIDAAMSCTSLIRAGRSVISPDATRRRDGYTAPAIGVVVVVGYGTDIVVVPVVVSVVSSVEVSLVVGSEDMVSVVVLVVVVVVVVVVVEVRAVVRVVDVVGTSVTIGAFACRDVCMTAKTSRPTATRPANPAATTTAGLSNQ
jgi:hypothetical protein